jgi:hypothetical protein
LLAGERLCHLDMPRHIKYEVHYIDFRENSLRRNFFRKAGSYCFN